MKTNLLIHSCFCQRFKFDRYILLLLIVTLLELPVFPQKTIKNSKTDLDTKVELLLKRMTLKEKVGQMAQIDIATFIRRVDPHGNFYGPQVEPNELVADSLQKYIVEYGIGSIFNIGSKGYTIEQWYHFITQIQEYAVKRTRLGIPILYGLDAIKGNSLTAGATVFPQPLGMACTWNPELVKKANEITAYEMRATNTLLNFGPNLDVGMHPLWSRLPETFGEDVYLCKVMGEAAVDGLEGENNDLSNFNKITSAIKHFVAYSFPVTGKDRTQAWIPELYVREYFLPPFEAAIKTGAHALVLNSAELNGEPIHASKYWITNVLRKELKFDGVILSDWRDIEKLYYQHHVATSYKEAIFLAIDAGIDMNMVPYDNRFMDLLIELVNEGKISEKRIDESVRRILKLKFELGLFDQPVRNYKDYPEFGGEKFRMIAKQAALESIVLLKNKNNTLPLNKNAKVLVVGPTANTMQSLNGGWTYSWQGVAADLFAQEKNTIFEAIQEKVGTERVAYSRGANFHQIDNLQDALDKAKNSDYIILCLGEEPYAETPGFIEDLYLPDAQTELAKTMASTGKPVILILAEGRPRLISKFEHLMDAVLVGFCPGNEGGDAFADIIFGDYNPSGKLCITYPRYPNDLMTYNYKDTDLPDHYYGNNGHQPQYRFGYGLSYTTFKYSNLNTNKSVYSEKDTIEISVDVENTGNKVGQETVLLFSRDVIARIVPPLHRLRRFEKITLHPGEKKTVTFRLTINDLKYVGHDNQWTTEGGEFIFFIDKLSKNINIELHK